MFRLSLNIMTLCDLIEKKHSIPRKFRVERQYWCDMSSCIFYDRKAI